jgi:hypothetical protein
LRQTSFRTRLKHLTGNGVFELKAVVRIIEPRALPRGRQKLSVIVRNRFVLQISHASPPSGAFAPSSIRCLESAAISLKTHAERRLSSPARNNKTRDQFLIGRADAVQTNRLLREMRISAHRGQHFRLMVDGIST